MSKVEEFLKVMGMNMSDRVTTVAEGTIDIAHILRQFEKYIKDTQLLNSKKETDY